MYQAKVVKIRTKEHPNADRIQLGYCDGYQVIVGLDVEDGDVGVLFPPDGKLHHDFLHNNNLYRDARKNKDQTKTGFFEDKGRVRAQPFRGEKSEGFWVPLHYFSWTGVDEDWFEVGKQFQEINGIKICEKYYTPATLRQRKQRRQKESRIDWGLPKHFDTDYFLRNIERFQSGAIVYITEKLHGTSHRVGYTLTRTESRSFWRRWIPFVESVKEEYKLVTGTRNTIVNDRPDIVPGHNEYFRVEVSNQLEGMLHKGEVIYGEVVGFNTNGGFIMQTQSTGKIPEIRDKYGDKMEYTYGCGLEPERERHRFFVYRITQINEDGHVVELSWPQVKRRAFELGLETPPELAGPFVAHVEEEIKVTIEPMLEGPSTLDDRHIREGVCIRLENPDGTVDVMKEKSFTFGVLEGYLKDEEDYVDLEEVS